MQTSITTWATSRHPLGPRAWHTWGPAAPGALPESLLWTNIQEDQSLGDSAVLSFLILQGDRDQEDGCARGQVRISRKQPTQHLCERPGAEDAEVKVKI